MRHAVWLTMLWLWPLQPVAEPPSDEVLERWFESDDSGPPQQDYSGGAELAIIAPLAHKPTPFSRTRLTITAQSLENGWVAVEQCHEELDPVPDAEVVYRFRQLRGLRITSQHGIAEAYVTGQSVQLKDAVRGAGLCVELEAKLLRPAAPGDYRLRYGPFMRKFLDSYFPMHLALEVSYPAERLRLAAVRPSLREAVAQDGEAGRYRVELWFRGQLTFDFRFLETARP